MFSNYIIREKHKAVEVLLYKIKQNYERKKLKTCGELCLDML